MPPAAYLVAKAVVSLTFGAAVVTLLFAMGAIFGGIRMPASQWAVLWSVLVAGAIPFGAIGLAIGNFAGPNSASGVVNMIYLPLGFLGGLWLPVHLLPPALQQATPYLPSYHFAQLALSIVRVPIQGTVAGHVEALAGFGILFAGIAWIGQSRDRDKIYG
jgi:ABC-2 type transport system permease protein